MREREKARGRQGVNNELVTGPVLALVHFMSSAAKSQNGTSIGQLLLLMLLSLGGCYSRVVLSWIFSSDLWSICKNRNGTSMNSRGKGRNKGRKELRYVAATCRHESIN